jgi:hypothetical protein
MPQQVPQQILIAHALEHQALRASGLGRRLGQTQPGSAIGPLTDLWVGMAVGAVGGLLIGGLLTSIYFYRPARR